MAVGTSIARPPGDAAAYSKRTANGRPYGVGSKPMNRRGGYEPPDAADVKIQNSVRRIRICLRIRLTLHMILDLLPGDRKDRPSEGSWRIRDSLSHPAGRDTHYGSHGESHNAGAS